MDTTILNNWIDLQVAGLEEQLEMARENRDYPSIIATQGKQIGLLKVKRFVNEEHT